MLDSDGANLDDQSDEASESEGKGSPSQGLTVASSMPNTESYAKDPKAAAADAGDSQTLGPLPLLPYSRLSSGSSKNEERVPPPKTMAKGLAIAASLILITAVGVAVAYDHIENARAWAAAARQDRTREANVATLKTRIDSIEVARSHEELAELRKVLTELRSGVSTAHDLSGSLAQLSARVDHIEKDQGARLDKLGDRIDHDAAVRLADIVNRLDRLEKKPAPAVASLPTPPSLPTTLKTLPVPKPEMAKVEPNVSNETTGSIEKPKPRLRNYFIDDIRNDAALIEGPGGAQSVRPGDYVPGAGRVVRIERRGHDWAVVTTQGLIVNGPDGY